MCDMPTLGTDVSVCLSSFPAMQTKHHLLQHRAARARAARAQGLLKCLEASFGGRRADLGALTHLYQPCL